MINKIWTLLIQLDLINFCWIFNFNEILRNLQWNCKKISSNWYLCVRSEKWKSSNLSTSAVGFRRLQNKIIFLFLELQIIKTSQFTKWYVRMLYVRYHQQIAFYMSSMWLNEGKNAFIWWCEWKINIFNRLWILSV